MNIKLKYLIEEYGYFVLLFFILILAVALRFYRFEDRWGLGYDQARDVLVAREALRLKKLPLIGPFASAGPFVYGPQWYWILMFFSILNFNWILMPWLMQNLVFVFMVYLMVLIGKEAINKYFGLLLGMFTAISTAQIAQATNLTTPSMVGLFAMLSVYFFIKYIKYGRLLDIFLLGFNISTSINIHFQAVGLLVLIPVVIIFGKKNIKNLLFLFIGLLIPNLPLLYFDITNNFFESKNILDYLLHGHEKIYIPRRWTTYAGSFWPESWARIIGGEKWVGYMVIVLTSLITALKFIKGKISKEMLSIIVVFLLVFTWLRYFRGNIFQSRLVFLHPFVFIITGWIVYEIFKINKFIAVLFASMIIIGSINLSYQEIRGPMNSLMMWSLRLADRLEKKYPERKFAIYDYKFEHGHSALSLSLFLDIRGLAGDDGIKIGVANSDYKGPGEKVFKDENLVDISHIKKPGDPWGIVTPRAIHFSTVEWFKGGSYEGN